MLRRSNLPATHAAWLDTLERLQGGWMERMFMARVPKWLRSHPDTGERVQRLLELEETGPIAVHGWSEEPVFDWPQIERPPRWHWTGLWH